MNRFLVRAVCASALPIIGMIALVPQARAVALFSNFNLPVSSTSFTPIGMTTPPALAGITRKGLRFTTGNTPYTLTEVAANFALDTGTDAATVTAAVYPGIGGGNRLYFPDGSANGTSIIPNPVATLQSQSVTALPGSPALYTFAANGTPVLEANTTYLVIFTAGSVRARWYNPTDSSEFPQARSGSGYFDPRYALYTGGSDSDVGGVGNSISAGRIEISGNIFVAVIPETGTLGLIFSGGAVALTMVLRRRRK